MADGSSLKPTWRKLGIDMNDMVPPDTAAVLMLHHLKLAAAYYGALELESEPEHEGDADGELIDPLSFYLRSNDERRKLVLRHLDRLYPERVGDNDFRTAAQMFLIASNEYWADVWKNEYAPAEADAEQGGDQ